MMRRGLRLTAVVAVVLVALTGFKSRGGRHGSGGGGGCSNSSSSSHHSSSGSGSGGYSDSDDYNSSTGSSGADSGGYRYNDRYDSNDSSSSSGSSSGGSAKTDRPVSTATVVKCAGKDKSGDPAATVKVRNDTGTSRTFVVEMEFRDKQGSKVTSGSAYARVPAKKTKSVKVLLDDPGVVGTVVTCEVVSVD